MTVIGHVTAGPRRVEGPPARTASLTGAEGRDSEIGRVIGHVACRGSSDPRSERASKNRTTPPPPLTPDGGGGPRSESTRAAATQ